MGNAPTIVCNGCDAPVIIRGVGFAAALMAHDAECDPHGGRTAKGWEGCKHKGDCYREVPAESTELENRSQ